MIEYKIKEILQKRGLSARTLAEKAKLSPNTISLIVKAKTANDYNATLGVIDSICLALDVKLEDVLKFKNK